jgi:gluconolactonase
MRSDSNCKQSSLRRRARQELGALSLAAGLFGCTSSPQGMTPGTINGASGTRAPGAGSSVVASGGNTGVAGSSLGTSGTSAAASGTSAAASGTSASAAGGVGGPATGGAGTLGASGSAGTGVATAGASGAAGTGAGASGAAGSNMPTTYPPLDAAAIGTPMQVASGFKLAESPLWDPCTHRLLFADANATGGGAINSLGPDGKTTVFMMNTGNTNGIAWDIDGSLILAQMNGHLARRSTSGMVTMLDPAGSNLHTPDDVVVRSDGTIYFSDGDFCPIGTLLGYNTALPVYTIKPNTTALINSGTVKGPNGIELSPDEKLLYVNGYGEGNIWRFDVTADGTITKQASAFVTGLTDPDSMCLDAAGNIYVAVSTGIQVLRPDGSKVKLITITAPAGSCTKAGMTNCTFGGDDGKTFYVTTWTTIMKIDNMPIPGLDWIVGNKRAKCM